MHGGAAAKSDHSVDRESSRTNQEPEDCNFNFGGRRTRLEGVLMCLWIASNLSAEFRVNNTDGCCPFYSIIAPLPPLLPSGARERTRLMIRAESSLLSLVPVQRTPAAFRLFTAPADHIHHALILVRCAESADSTSEGRWVDALGEAAK